MENYKYPPISLLILSPISPSSNNSSSCLKPHSLKKHISGKTIKFSSYFNVGEKSGDTVCYGDGGIIATVTLSLEINGREYTYNAFFRPPYLYSNDKNKEDGGDSTLKYGVIVNFDTQVHLYDGVTIGSFGAGIFGRFSHIGSKWALNTITDSLAYKAATYTLRLGDIIYGPRLLDFLIGTVYLGLHLSPGGSIPSKHMNSLSVQVHSLLLIGKPGSGCTSLAYLAARYSKAHCIVVRAGELMARAFSRNKIDGAKSIDPVGALKIIFMKAFSIASYDRPCIVYFDDLHVLTPSKQGQVEAALAEELIRFLHLIKKENNGHNKKIFTIGRTFNESMLCKNVGDSFEEKIELPDKISSKSRMVLISSMLQVAIEEDTNISLSEREKTQFIEDEALLGTAPVPVISSIIYLKRKIATFLHTHKTLPISSDVSSKTKDDAIKQVITELHTLLQSFAFTTGSDSNEKKKISNCLSRKEKSLLSMQHIIGLDVKLSILRERILWPRLHANFYKKFKVKRFATGILLLGPPGTGKTMIPRNIAEEFGCRLVVMRLSEVICGEVGASEKLCVSIFEEAMKFAPSIIFIDEFQAIFQQSTSQDTGHEIQSSLSSCLASCFDRIVDWNETQGPESLVTVMASTNEPWAISESFLRSGRLELRLFLGCLEYDDREKFLYHFILAKCKAFSHSYFSSFLEIVKQNDHELNIYSLPIIRYASTLCEYIEELARIDDYTTNRENFASLLEGHLDIHKIVDTVDGFTGADMSYFLSKLNLLDETDDVTKKESLYQILLNYGINGCNDFGGLKDTLIKYVIVSSVPNTEVTLRILEDIHPSVTQNEIKEYKHWLERNKNI